MLALRLDCSTAALTTPHKVLFIWKLVELKMLDFRDRMRAGTYFHLDISHSWQTGRLLLSKIHFTLVVDGFILFLGLFQRDWWLRVPSWPDEERHPVHLQQGPLPIPPLGLPEAGGGGRNPGIQVRLNRTVVKSRRFFEGRIKWPAKVPGADWFERRPIVFALVCWILEWFPKFKNSNIISNKYIFYCFHKIVNSIVKIREKPNFGHTDCFINFMHWNGLRENSKILENFKWL